jgi:demethylmenaquinone methyltransferase/2-methoxy-6-polyprenyl-1,4-benzoquinol methylase
MKETVTPYNSNDTKKQQVASMFNNVAGTYDFLNHFFSLGIDTLWRKKVVKLIKAEQPKIILDVATGTADLAIAEVDTQAEKIIGIDISNKMLDVGKAKLKKLNIKNIELLEGDSENIMFDDNTFDAISVSFGVRNFENLKAGLSEMRRVLKPNKKVFILEFSIPTNFIIRNIYYLYFLYILPFVGKIISKDARAYAYLPESVRQFPSGNEFVTILKACNFNEIKCIPLFFGISTIYIGKK